MQISGCYSTDKRWLFLFCLHISPKAVRKAVCEKWRRSEEWKVKNRQDIRLADFWRTDRDSNPRTGLTVTRFPVVRLRPTRPSVQIFASREQRAYYSTVFPACQLLLADFFGIFCPGYGNVWQNVKKSDPPRMRSLTKPTRTRRKLPDGNAGGFSRKMAKKRNNRLKNEFTERVGGSIMTMSKNILWCFLRSSEKKGGEKT